VIVYVTASADGKIATKTGFSKFSCPFDLMRLHEMRSKVDAVMVGANTVIRDDPLLTVRYVEAVRQPLRVIIDGLLRIPLNSKVVKDKTAKTVVFTSLEGPRDKEEMLLREGVDVIRVNSSRIIPLSTVLQILMERYNVGKVLIEGGATLLWYAFKERVVDEFRITVSPFIVGGENAVPVVGGEGFNDMNDIVKLKLVNVEVCRCGSEVHLVYVLH